MLLFLADKYYAECWKERGSFAKAPSVFVCASWSVSVTGTRIRLSPVATRRRRLLRKSSPRAPRSFAWASLPTQQEQNNLENRRSSSSWRSNSESFQSFPSAFPQGSFVNFPGWKSLLRMAIRFIADFNSAFVAVRYLMLELDEFRAPRSKFSSTWGAEHSERWPSVERLNKKSARLQQVGGKSQPVFCASHYISRGPKCPSGLTRVCHVHRPKSPVH